MLIFTLISVLISNAVATNQSKSILYSRNLIFAIICITVITINAFYIKPLNTGLGLYNGFFNISFIGQYFNLFIFIIIASISVLTAFFPRKIYQIGNGEDLIKNKLVSSTIKNWFAYKPFKINKRKRDLLLNKNGFQYTIIEYSLIILFVLCGAILLISTGDLLSLFLSIELQSYGLYIISTIYRDSESATNSGLTYFLLGGLSSCFILLGSAILYVNSGNTNMDNIFIINNIREQLTNTNEISYSLHSTLYTGNYINFSFIILVVGLLFKISAAPFHFWSPDVYDGIPTIVTTFVAIIAKISLLLILLELVSYTDINTSNIHVNQNSSDVLNYNIDYSWKNILLLSSLMSLVIGSVLGLSQYRIKRLFAYSTISHIGFILLALSINEVESVQGYIFYILQYSLSNLNAFFILITMGYTLHGYIINGSNRDKNLNKKKLENTDKYPGTDIDLKDSEIKNTGSIVDEDLKKKIHKNTGNTEDKLIDVENSPIQLLSQIKGYFYVNSYLCISFAITLFSFVGIPPLIGFFAKQMVLSAALDQGYIFISFVAIITSVIGAAYYLNIIKLIFFTKTDYSMKDSSNYGLYDRVKEYNYMPYINDKLSVVISTLTMLILLFIFMPDEWFRIVSILSFSVSKY